MRHGFAEWRLSLLTTLGLGAALGCGGSTTSDLFGSAGSGGATPPRGVGGQPSSGMAGGPVGVGGRLLAGGSGGGTPAGSGGTPVVVGASGEGGSSGSRGEAVECRNPRPYQPGTNAGIQLLSRDEAPSQSQALVVFPVIEGWVVCEGGWLHRTSKKSCPSKLPRESSEIPGWAELEGAECASDADCTEKPLGYCVAAGQFPVPRCNYGCTDDSECAPGSVCLCDDPVGRCQPASCELDKDCGSFCAGTPDPGLGCGAPTYTFACIRPADECVSNADCPERSQGCFVDEDGRQCRPQPVCGRPFLVAGRPRTAPARVLDGGWSGGTAVPDCATLDVGLRAKLAAHFTELGLMEHASVAAFARFVLELLSLAAPADLVRDAQRALADEIAHTELCFGLAGAYGGEPVAPGVLPMDGALEARTRLEIVKTAVLEACIGETVAAVEARLACEAALDTAVRSALTRIAEDEARHAELGWRFVHWVLRTSAPDFAGEIQSALREITRENARSFEGRAERAFDLRLTDHGYASEAMRARARELAFSELILPWTRALLAEPLAA